MDSYYVLGRVGEPRSPAILCFFMGRFRDHQKLRAKYGASADDLREEFTRSLDYAPEAEVAENLRHLRDRPIRPRTREPNDCAVSEISDVINQRGALLLPIDVRAALGISASETIRHSDVEKLLSGESLGSELLC